MRNPLSALLAPVAVAALAAVAIATPASATTICETAFLATGDQVRTCVDTADGCVAAVDVAGVPPLPRASACQPHPPGLTPPSCDGVVGDVTTECLP